MVNRPKMTLDQLRALRPVWHPVEPVVVTISEATDSDDSDEAADLAAANIMAIADGLRHRRASAAAALHWLHQTDTVARAYLVARLYCPNGKRLADLYCLPENCLPVRDSGGHRLLVVPTSRGRLTALAGDANNTRKSGAPWWYISDDDVWDLRCKCCPHPDGGIRAADFLSDDPPTGYSTVLL